MGRPVQITLQTVGSPDELNAYALKLAEQLKQVPGLVDIDVSYKPGKPEAQIVVDRRKAADLGINAATVGGTVRMLVEGDKVATYKGEGAEADIRVQFREEDRQKLEQVLELQVPTTPRVCATAPDRSHRSLHRPDADRAREPAILGSRRRQCVRTHAIRRGGRRRPR